MAPIDQWLEVFALDGSLVPHVAEVLASLPDAVRQDLMGDPDFVLCDYEPGTVAHIPVRLPALRGQAGRSVVLKRSLRRRHPEFVRYVIAHELAHAHLRNRGRWADDDPELAADSLAAAWGFPKPSFW